MERTFCGLNRAQLNVVLNTMCELEERIPDLTDEEQDMYDIGVQCVCQIVNRIADNKPINWS